MDLQLTGKRALVTGGSRGIGRAIARSLLEEGARVVIASRDLGHVQAAAAELAAASGGEVYGLAVTTQDDVSVDMLIADTVRTLGGIDILVNAAARPGTAPAKPGLAGITSDYAIEEFNTKVLGYLRCARAAVPHMIPRGWGRIINIGGLAARSTGSAMGSIRNVAVSSLTKSLADEFGPKGINVTVVHPGTTRTERTPAMLQERAKASGRSEAEVEQALGNATLIGRIVEADEIAWIVTFLASPRSAAINGDAIPCGGGVPRAIYY